MRQATSDASASAPTVQLGVRVWTTAPSEGPTSQTVGGVESTRKLRTPTAALPAASRTVTKKAASPLAIGHGVSNGTAGSHGSAVSMDVVRHRIEIGSPLTANVKVGV